MVINRHILIILILISALGVVAIPFGNPKFIGDYHLSHYLYWFGEDIQKHFMLVLRWH
jgi:hypothetical protein